MNEMLLEQNAQYRQNSRNGITTPNPATLQPIAVHPVQQQVSHQVQVYNFNCSRFLYSYIECYRTQSYTQYGGSIPTDNVASC